MPTARPVFSIATPRDLMEKVIESNLRELELMQTDLALLNCIIPASHMQDWVRHHWLSDVNDPEHVRRWQDLQPRVTWRSAGPLPTHKEWNKWIDEVCPWASYVRDVTNHAKHVNPIEATSQGVMNPSSDGPPGSYEFVQTWTMRTEPDDELGAPQGTGVLIYMRGALEPSALGKLIIFWRNFLREHSNWT